MYIFSCASMQQCPILLGRGTAYSFLFLCHHPPVGTQRAASAYMALGGGFRTQHAASLLSHTDFRFQISVWSAFKFQAVFLSPLALNLSPFRFPFVTPLRSPVACNCDLFSTSVNSKVYYLQPSTLNVKHSTFFCVLLRYLRENERIRVLFLHTDYAKSAEYFLFRVSR